MVEKWRPVVGYRGRYSVSSDGRVRSFDMRLMCRAGASRVHRGRVLSITKNAKGYLRCSLGRDNKFKTIEVHRLVIKTFVKKVAGKYYCNHKNGIKTDNRVENLEWCTHKENCQHAQDSGLNRSRFSQKQKEAARRNGILCRKINIKMANRIKAMRIKTKFGGLRISNILGIKKWIADGILYRGNYDN